MLTRIVIAERQELFREALRNLLESQPDFNVVGETGDGNQLASLVLEHKPDLLLLDPRLRNRSGIEALRLVAEQSYEVCTILLPESIAPAEMIQFLLSGVRGVVPKNTPTKLLFKSIRTVVDGQYWLTHKDVGEVMKNLRSFADTAKSAQLKSAQIKARSLSRQQLQIVEAVVAGCSNKDIAQDLLVSERNVKYHLTRIFNKFEVASRTELARYSLKNNVVREV